MLHEKKIVVQRLQQEIYNKFLAITELRIAENRIVVSTRAVTTSTTNITCFLFVESSSRSGSNGSAKKSKRARSKLI